MFQESGKKPVPPTEAKVRTTAELKIPQRMSVPIALASCFIAGLVSLWVFLLPPLFMAAVFAQLSFKRSEYFWLLGLGLGALGLYAGTFLPGNLIYLPSGIATLLCAWVVSFLVAHKKASITLLCICIALLGLALYLIESQALAQQGMTVVSAIDQMTKQFMQTMPESSVEFIQSRDFFVQFLPVLYLSQAAIAVLLARIGARGSMKSIESDSVTRTDLAAFDLPLWAGLLLILALALLGITQFKLLDIDWIQMAGLNLLMALRPLYTLQTIGVGLWFVQKRKPSRFVSFLLVVILVELEMLFYVGTVVGFIDLFANFRGRERTFNLPFQI